MARHNMARHNAALLAAGFWLLLQPFPAVGATKTLRVDCSKGHTINRALKDQADTLVIEIEGICEEDVQVRRSNVTLRGSDPLVDGIRAAVDEPLRQALNLFGVYQVNVENLKLTGGRVGLGINRSFAVDIVNCRIEGNEVAGVIFGTASGSNDLVDTVVTDNGGLGIWVANGSHLRCTRCTVESGPSSGAAARITQGSELQLTDSSIAGFRGIQVFGGGRVFSNVASSIEGTATAVETRGTASIELWDASVVGTLDLRQGSTLVLGNATQTSPGSNSLRSGSRLVARGTTRLAGDLELSELSAASLPGTTTVDGSLFCSRGADVYCDDPAASVGGTSDCGQCPKP